MAKNPVLPLYYNDIICSTKTWTDEEFGAYMRLLIEQWDKGFIPSDMKRLQRIADSVNENWPVLSQKFTPGEDGNLRNLVMEEIRIKKEKFSEHQRENVRKRLPNSYQKPTKQDTKNLPLEEEIEIEEEIENKEENKELIIPFESENFIAKWEYWKSYRKEEFKKSYKSKKSEQMALNHLAKLSGNDESKAIRIIDESMGNQWQGLFELKNEGVVKVMKPTNEVAAIGQKISEAQSRKIIGDY